MTQKKDEDGNPVVNKDGKPIMEHPTCGGIIPRGQNKVQDDGNFVYEFTGSNRISSKTGKYIENYPTYNSLEIKNISIYINIYIYIKHYIHLIYIYIYIYVNV